MLFIFALEFEVYAQIRALAVRLSKRLFELLILELPPRPPELQSTVLKRPFSFADQPCWADTPAAWLADMPPGTASGICYDILASAAELKAFLPDFQRDSAWLDVRPSNNARFKS